LRILFDKNVPVGVRYFLPAHEVRTVTELGWHPQLQNGDLLRAAEAETFDVLVTCDQNITYQQNMSALVVFGSNIWRVVRVYRESIVANVEATVPGGYYFIEMPHPAKPPKKSAD
jgi:hypothetical protein